MKITFKGIAILWCVAIVLFILIVVLNGCSVNASKVDTSMAKKMAEKVTYFKDYNTGLCFAVVASRKDLDIHQTGMGLSNVPCDACEEQLVNFKQEGDE